MPRSQLAISLAAWKWDVLAKSGLLSRGMRMGTEVVDWFLGEARREPKACGVNAEEGLRELERDVAVIRGNLFGEEGIRRLMF